MMCETCGRPKLLDLFCGAGGAAMGYHRAGFCVIGVDMSPQRYFPFAFIQGDAMNPPVDLSTFAAIHASPPCPRYSVATPVDRRHLHPDLVAPCREMLNATGLPWIMENVPGSPVRADYLLCGTMFDLRSKSGLIVRRHRYFETGGGMVPDLFGIECRHPSKSGQVMSISGNGTPSGTRRALGRNVSVQEWREGMDMPWCGNRFGIAQAIPPAYTEYIGRQLLAHIHPQQKGPHT